MMIIRSKNDNNDNSNTANDMMYNNYAEAPVPESAAAAAAVVARLAAALRDGTAGAKAAGEQLQGSRRG